MSDDCLGCNLIERQAIRWQGRLYCPTCPSLPEERRRPVDEARAGAAELLREYGPTRRQHAVEKH